MYMYAHQNNFFYFFGEDPTTGSFKVKYCVSFCFIFANQNIKAWSQHIPKYQKAKKKKKKIMLNVLLLISSSLYQPHYFVKSKACLAVSEIPSHGVKYIILFLT